MRNELVSPGILGLVSASSPFALAYNIWWTEAYVDPRPELAFFSGPLEFFLICLGLVIAFYGARSLIGSEHRVNGSVVLAGSILTGLIVTPSLLRTPTPLDGLILAGYLSSSMMGIVGGLKGIYWQRSWKDGAAVTGLAEYSRWAVIGGVVLLCVAPWFYPEILTLLGSLMVIVSGTLVYKGIGSRRLVGLAIIACALLAGNPFWLGDPASRFVYPYSFPFFRKDGPVFYTKLDPVMTAWGILGLAGTVLSVIAGVKIWTWKTTRVNGPM